MNARYGLVLMLVVAASLFPAPLGAAEDPVGTWVGTTEVPDQGTDAVTLTITRVSGGYGGVMADSLKQVAGEALTNLQFSDGVLSFNFLLTDGTTMKMTLKLSGDRMAGEWQHPEGSAGAITFDRKKA